MDDPRHKGRLRKRLRRVFGGGLRALLGPGSLARRAPPPLDERQKLIERLIGDPVVGRPKLNVSDYLRQGSLSPKNRAIYDALLASYQGDYAMVLRHVRVERDTFGPIDVPADHLWGAQTQRSIGNFDISGERMPIEIVRALVQIKRASAVVNHKLGTLDAKKAA